MLRWSEFSTLIGWTFPDLKMMNASASTATPPASCRPSSAAARNQNQVKLEAEIQIGLFAPRSSHHCRDREDRCLNFFVFFPEKLVCLNHLDRLCKTCSFGECTLIYRYTLDELKIMQINLRKHVSENGMSKKVEPVGKGLFTTKVSIKFVTWLLFTPTVTRRKQVLLF